MSLSTLPHGMAPLRDASMGEPVPVVSMRDIVRTIFRHLVPILVIVGIALTGAFGYLLYTSPTYTSQSKVLVRVGREKLAPLAVGTEPFTNFVFNERVENTNDEIEILRNPHLMALVFPELKARYDEMVAASKIHPVPVTTLEKIRDVVRIVKENVSAGIHWTADMLHEPLYFLGISHRLSPDDMLFALLQTSLGVDFVKETNIIVLSFSWAEPNYAAFALNTIAQAYRRERVRLLSDVTGAGDFYTNQATRTDQAVKAVNKEVDDYLAASGLTDPVTEKQLVMSLVSGLERQQADGQVTEQQTKDRLTAIKRKFDRTTEWLETPGVPNVTLSGPADLDARYTELMTRRNALITTYTSDSRQVQDIDSQIATLRRAKLQSLTNYLNDRLAGENQEQKIIAERLAEQRAKLERLNAVTTHYASLIDQRDQLLAQLKEYRKQIEVLGVTQSLNDRGFSSVVILNPGVPPDAPSAPRKGLIMGLAAGFGVLFAAAFVILSEFFNHTFASERDVARVLGLRLVASLPRVKAGRESRR